MAGWEGSTRKSTLPPGWETQIRPVVLERCGGRCEIIKANGRRCWDKAVAVDHITPHSQGGSDDWDNLQGICAWHHQRKSSSEGAYGRQKAEERWRKLLKREPEQMPGAVDPADAKPKQNRGF